jgi:hypothetical protein
VNIIINCLVSQELFILIPKINGAHCVIPAITAKTAPIEST